MKIDLKKGLIPAFTAVAVATSLGSVSLAQAADVHLLWVQAMKDHPVHRLMQAGFLNKCKELGYTCEVVGDPSATNWDIPATLPLAEAALARTKYDAIGVYGVDPAIYSYITKLAKEGFPIVTWHVLPPEGTVNGLKAATGEDIAEVGANAAIAIGDKLGGKGTVALTQGASNDTENAMSDAFRKTIQRLHAVQQLRRNGIPAQNWTCDQLWKEKDVESYLFWVCAGFPFSAININDIRQRVEREKRNANRQRNMGRG